MSKPPSYIDEAAVRASTSKFAWDGEGMHYGPSQGTKLHKALEKLDTCTHATLTSLIAEWLVWRLYSSVKRPERYLQYLDTVVAWEIDWRYHDQTALQGEIPTDTAAHQALGDGIYMVRCVADDEYWVHPAASTASSAALVSIIKQTLSNKEKAAFTKWLDWALAQAAKLGPLPRKKRPERDDFDSDEAYHDATRPHFGKPLPREALDPSSGYKPEQREELLARYLERLDWKTNPFLRSPDAMKKLGFRGKPYKL